MNRSKKSKPAPPRLLVSCDEANDNARATPAEGPRVKDGPSARILRQMLKVAHVPARVETEAAFEWSDSQLTRLRRAEQKRNSKDRRTQANGVAEIARLAAERDSTIARICREKHETETVALARGRGEEIEQAPQKPGEPAKPMLRRSGLEWLRRKGRIDQDQYVAGHRYGDDYRRATEVSLKSCISDQTGSGRDTGLSHQEAREEAFLRLRAARVAGLQSHPKMIATVDNVCGEGRTVRQLTGDNEADAQQYEAALLIALDLLHQHYKMVRR